MTLRVSVPLLYSFERHWHACTCVLVALWVPVLCEWRWAEPLWFLRPRGSTQGEDRPGRVKIKRVSGWNLHILGVRLRGLFGCLFSPWDLNVLFCRSCALITISSPDIPAAQLVGGFFPAMINYSLSESKSAFSSLIISDEFILLTWAWIEAIDDNKLTLSILMTSLGDYGWIKE